MNNFLFYSFMFCLTMVSADSGADKHDERISNQDGSNSYQVFKEQLRSKQLYELADIQYQALLGVNSDQRQEAIYFFADLNATNVLVDVLQGPSDYELKVDLLNEINVAIQHQKKDVIDLVNSLIQELKKTTYVHTGGTEVAILVQEYQTALKKILANVTELEISQDNVDDDIHNLEQWLVEERKENNN